MLALGAALPHIQPVKPFAFVPPTDPVLTETPPKGKGRCHEVKFDGYRLQLHKVGDQAVILSDDLELVGMVAGTVTAPRGKCLILRGLVAKDLPERV